MKKFLFHIMMIVPAACPAASVNNEPEITLNIAEDRVLPTKLRTSVLEVAEASLNRSDEAFIAIILKARNPYPVREETIKAPSEVFIEEEIDDASILELIQSNLSTQIRGRLAKDGVYYLQLNGGGMLEAGANFPVQIPQIEGKSFTVTVLEITPRGYTLKMNDVIQEVTFETSSGIIKNSDK